MAITGACRKRPLVNKPKDRFWDRRPYTRILKNFKEFLRLNNYIELNELEGLGMTKSQAKMLIANLATLAEF